MRQRITWPLPMVREESHRIKKLVMRGSRSTLCFQQLMEQLAPFDPSIHLGANWANSSDRLRGVTVPDVDILTVKDVATRAAIALLVGSFPEVFAQSEREEAKLGFDASDVLRGNCIEREYEWFDREAATPLGCVVTLSSSVKAMCPRSVLIMAPRRVKMALLTKKQRELAKAIKRARHIGLLPYVVK